MSKEGRQLPEDASENPVWIPVTPEEITAQTQSPGGLTSKVDEIFLKAAQEGRLSRMSDEAQLELDRRFREAHEEFLREMHRRANMPVKPVYFPPHPGLPGPHALWEDD